MTNENENDQTGLCRECNHFTHAPAICRWTDAPEGEIEECDCSVQNAGTDSGTDNNVTVVAAIANILRENDHESSALDIEGTGHATIEFGVGDLGRTVMVYIDRPFASLDWCVKVNWSAIGSVTPNTAERFASNLTRAYSIAQEIETAIVTTT